MQANDNPFRRSQIAKLRYRITDEQKQATVEKIVALGHRAVILGPHGSGKSTLLEDLQALFEGTKLTTRHMRIHRESSHRSKKQSLCQLLNQPKSHITFLDGGENLGFLTWMYLSWITKKRGIKLVATVHYPCFLPVVLRTHASEELSLTFSEYLAGEAWSPELQRVAAKAFKANKGNMREVFAACYLHLAR